MAFSEERAGDLVLALMQLTLHEECRAWKSYDWDVMNYPHERGFITDPRSKAKSVSLPMTAWREVGRCTPSISRPPYNDR